MNRRRSDKSNQQESKKRLHASEVVRRKNVHLLIDGYNLMHVTRFTPTSDQPGELQRCREGLLALLADELSPQQYASITIVFDSDNAPKHLPDRTQWRHIEVQFARDENSADDFIVTKIREQTTRKSLIVVSSDHRVHVASGKKATVVDSDLWFDAILSRPRHKNEVEEDDDLPPEGLENPFPKGYFDDVEET